MRKRGKLFVIVNKEVPLTQKKEKSRMGGGAGPIKLYALNIPAGQPIFKLVFSATVDIKMFAQKYNRLLNHKLLLFSY